MAQSPIAPETRAKQGFLKIQAFANLARTDGWKWIWVDTCCIDKTSSADLSESINSMYKWYRSAGGCYVYLSDLPGPQPSSLESLPKCRWLTRGWTLQELIAPPNVRFYSQSWEFCFTKAEKCQELSQITSIDQRVLRGQMLPSACSMAQRMSWASKRHTTRPEDMAYCLLGLFDINMPMLYGEGGQKAFIRLQQEILKGPFDESLFAWTSRHNKPFTYRGLLARHPREFEFSGHLRQRRGEDSHWWGISKISVSNLGFKVRFPYYQFSIEDSLDGSHQTNLAVLQCLPASVDSFRSRKADYICILIKRVAFQPETYIRLYADKLYSLDELRRVQPIDPEMRDGTFYMPIDAVNHIELPANHTTNQLIGFFPIESFDSPWKTVTYGCSDSSLEWDVGEHGWIASSDPALNTASSPNVTHMAIMYSHDYIEVQGLAMMIVVSWDPTCHYLNKPGYFTDVVEVPHKTVISEYLKEYDIAKRKLIRTRAGSSIHQVLWTDNLRIMVYPRIFGIDAVGAAVEITGQGDWDAMMESVREFNN